MSSDMTRTFLALCATLALPVAAHAEPPAPVDAGQVERLLDMSESLSAMVRELGESLSEGDGRVHTLIEDPDAFREAARDLERMIDEADVIESLADFAIALSERVEVVEDDSGLTLSLDGREVASVEADGTDRLSIRAGGRRITVETD